MAFALKRRLRSGALISVVSLIDVLMILLIFFMVTSTYLDLNMVPALAPSSGPAAPPEAAQAAPDAPPNAPPDAADTGRPPVLLLRIAPDGAVRAGGERLPPEGLAALLSARLAADPQLQVALFPSPGASMQALVSAMDAASAAGVRHLRVIRLEATQ